MFTKLFASMKGTAPTPPSILKLARTKEQMQSPDIYPRFVVHPIGQKRFIVVDTHRIKKSQYRARTGDGCMNVVCTDPENVHCTLYIFRGGDGLKAAEKECEENNRMFIGFLNTDNQRQNSINETLAIQ